MSSLYLPTCQRTSEVHKVNACVPLLASDEALCYSGTLYLQTVPLHPWHFPGCLAFYQMAWMQILKRDSLGFCGGLRLSALCQSAVCPPPLLPRIALSHPEAVSISLWLFPLIPSLEDRSKGSVNKIGYKTRCLQFPAPVQAAGTSCFSLVSCNRLQAEQTHAKESQIRFILHRVIILVL